jgi:hypothetical protein
MLETGSDRDRAHAPVAGVEFLTRERHRQRNEGECRDRREWETAKRSAHEPSG